MEEKGRKMLQSESIMIIGCVCAEGKEEDRKVKMYGKVNESFIV